MQHITPRLVRNRKVGSYTKIIAAFVLFFILTGVGFLFSTGARTGAETVAKPLWTTFNFITRPVAYVTNFFRTQNSLVSQNLALQNQVDSLTLKETDYDTIVKENNDLRNEIGTNDTSNQVVARVLSKPPQSPYDTLVIDSGSSDSVTLGDTVYMSGTLIIGYVTSVTPHTSLVTLFSANGQSEQATNSRTGASFELKGLGGANFSVQVPKDTDIMWGDTFLYPAKSASIIGNIYYIDSDSQSSFKTVYLRLPVNVFSAQWVFVQK